jgi:hypothetical protein
MIDGILILIMRTRAQVGSFGGQFVTGLGQSTPQFLVIQAGNREASVVNCGDIRLEKKRDPQDMKPCPLRVDKTQTMKSPARGFRPGTVREFQFPE